jgi:hypothetical protein
MVFLQIESWRWTGLIGCMVSRSGSRPSWPLLKGKVNGRSGKFAAAISPCQESASSEANAELTGPYT